MLKGIGNSMVSKTKEKIGFFRIFVLIVGALLVILLIKNAKKKFTETQQKWLINRQCKNVSAKETIFVSIASSYGNMDEAIYTIIDLYEKSYCPYRVYIGIQQTNDEKERKQPGFKSKIFLDRYKKLCKSTTFENNIRILNEEPSHERGSSNARYMIEKYLYKGEKYYMIIDNSTLFCWNWDKILIEDFNRCLLKSPRPILTQYPELNTNLSMKTKKANSNYISPPTFLCFRRWSEYGLPLFKKMQFKNPPVRPFISLFWCPKFSFTLGSVIQQVPHDPWYHYLNSKTYSWSMSARLWTNGWDFFSPTKCIVYTNEWKYNQNKTKKTLKNDRQQREAEDSYYRIWSLLGILENNNDDKYWNQVNSNLGEYGLGFERTIEEFQIFTGLDWILRKSEPHAFVGMQKYKNTTREKRKNMKNQFPFQNEEIVAKYGSWTEFYEKTNYEE